MTKNKTIMSFSLSKEAVDMLNELHEGTGNNSRSRSLETIIEFAYHTFHIAHRKNQEVNNGTSSET